MKVKDLFISSRTGLIGRKQRTIGKIIKGFVKRSADRLSIGKKKKVGTFHFEIRREGTELTLEEAKEASGRTAG